LAHASEQLSDSEHLRQDAGRDALVILLHITGLTRAALHAAPERALTLAQVAAYDAAIQRRLQNEPIQYITGEQEFYGLALQVTPAVLIPRPETEHLVESVLAELDSVASLRILDVGTGSGAIAIALAHHLPNAHIVATDISPAALEVAAQNANRHHLATRITFIETDLLAALPMRNVQSPTAFTREARPERHEVLDAIVSNPPYVATADRDTLHPQVRDYEPATALFAGVSGLDIYQRLIPQADAALKPGGLLALEIGYNQRDAIAELLAGWTAVRFVNDLQQIPRVVLARKR
jgi:release factor glutamine methyltransferase